MLFNAIIFVTVAVVLTKHNLSRQKRKTAQKKLKLPPKEACKLILSLSGITALLGLTWIFSVFTAMGANTNRDAAIALQWLFVFFNSFQGFFLFVFFVVLSSDARNLWLTLLCPGHKTTEPPTSKTRLRYSGGTSTTKPYVSSSNEYSSVTLPEKATHEMVKVNPNVIYQDIETEGVSPDLPSVETTVDDLQSVSEKEGSSSQDQYAEQLQVKARVKRFSTIKKTHHVETAEVDFLDDFNDENDEENIVH